MPHTKTFCAVFIESPKRFFFAQFLIIFEFRVLYNIMSGSVKYLREWTFIFALCRSINDKQGRAVTSNSVGMKSTGTAYKATERRN